jgi:hypothetical protein
MVGHQNPPEAAKSQLRQETVQTLQEIDVVGAAEEDSSALDAADHHVVDGARGVESRRAGDR